jgi:uncharacterized cupredoxin-like copper-binding protein
MHRIRLALILGLGITLTACGTGDGGPSSDPSSDADPRTITATLSDDMAIQLSESDFEVGETVRFEVTNEGAIPHEFYVGDAEAQEHHAEEMAEMDGMGHDEPDGVAVDPGATETFEYTFEQSGEILAGCHEPGHYEAGMVTSMTVAGQ